ncbi:MAG: hypothetical protein KDB61_10715, partial [Planctomycetes bacterium]|nr:hypothetical protein [Planctomycetota bacterium]
GYDHRVLLGNGPLLVDVPANASNFMLWRYLGVIGPSEFLDANLPLRDFPPLTHATLHIVAFTLSNGVRAYTNSVSPVVLDTAW